MDSKYFLGGVVVGFILLLFNRRSEASRDGGIGAYASSGGSAADRLAKANAILQNEKTDCGCSGSQKFAPVPELLVISLNPPSSPIPDTIQLPGAYLGLDLNASTFQP